MAPRCSELIRIRRRRHGFPLDLQDDAIKVVIKRAEVLARECHSRLERGARIGQLCLASLGQLAGLQNGRRRAVGSPLAEADGGWDEVAKIDGSGATGEAEPRGS
jgi:hypothetical protein